MENDKQSGAAVQAAPEAKAAKNRAEERPEARSAAPKKPEAKKAEHKYGFSFLYWFIVRLYWLVAKVLFFIRVEGRAHIPTDRNIILMGNHQCLFDPLSLAICAPGQQVHFMGKKELWNNRLLGWAFTQVHGFPVDRGNVDMAAIRTAMDILKHGDSLGIFPEGTRTKGPQMGPLLSGTAMLALRSGCDVVPVYIDGDYTPFRRITVRVGEPVVMDDLRAGRINKEAFDALTARVEESFYQLSGGKSRA